MSSSAHDTVSSADKLAQALEEITQTDSVIGLFAALQMGRAALAEYRAAPQPIQYRYTLSRDEYIEFLDLLDDQPVNTKKLRELLRMRAPWEVNHD